MMKALLSMFPLFTLLCPVASLTCHSCRSPGNNCEPKTTEECESHDAYCVASIVEVIFFQLKKKYAFKSCTDSCYSGYTSASLHKSMHGRTQVFCCNTDNCNDVSLTLPKHFSNTPNGLQCPGCYSSNSDHCEAQYATNCSGQEDHCFYYAGDFSLGKSSTIAAARGCCTTNFCVFKKGEAGVDNAAFTGRIVQAECSLAKPAPLH